AQKATPAPPIGAPGPKPEVKPWWKRNRVVVVITAVVVYYFRPPVPEKLADLPDPARQLLDRFNFTRTVDKLFREREEWAKSQQIPGRQLQDKLKAKHPLVMIPGIISCGLEAWKPAECLGATFFRERVWGGLSMARAVLHNMSCWLDHLELDPITGVDPPHKEVRAADGVLGADYFVPGYWLWGKFIESAAAIGYHSGNLKLACYDWRLSFNNLEKRDGYYSHLRRSIEQLVQSTGEKAVVIGHSMGASVWIHFMQWVTVAAGETWVATHIHAFVPLAGALLGAVGPLGALLSGE
ncbi:unnamed protein product, partial [Polarella glacialis]